MEHTLPKDPQSNLITDRAAIFNMAWKQHDISYHVLLEENKGINVFKR